MQKSIRYGLTMLDPRKNEVLYSASGSLSKVLSLVADHIYGDYMPNYQKVRRELVAGSWASMLLNHNEPVLITILPDSN